MLNINDMPTWQLTNLYPSDDCKELQDDFQSAKDIIQDILLAKGKITSYDSNELLAVIKKYEKLSNIMGKISSYAGLRFSQKSEDTQTIQFYQNIKEKLNVITSDIIFLSLELNNIEDGKLAQFFQENKDLEFYKPWIMNAREFKKYQLDENLEKLLHDKRLTSTSALVRLFDETSASLRFNWEGKKVNSTMLLNELTNKDGKKRQESALEFVRVLKENENLFAFITNNLAKDKSIEDEWRGFDKPISSRNLENLVEDEVVSALISSVKAQYKNTSHRYYKLKAKMLGMDKLNWWDRNAPLPEDNDQEISWQEAKDIVLKAYKDFDPEIGNIAEEFFSNGYIDAPVYNGKSSGAFAHPTVTTEHPYILVNYQGKTRDVMTLAHEIGHGVHQVLAQKQGDLVADTPLTLAETASVFGEMLTFQSLLKRCENDSQRKIMLTSKIEDTLNTCVRQIAFCDFETRIHDERKNGELSAKRISELWIETQSTSFGDGMKMDEDYNYMWSYIPHFIHTPFYVYAYAFGDCLVNSLYQVFKDNKVDDFQAKYHTMLSSGGRYRHKELLAPFNLNAHDPEFWTNGMKLITTLIDDLEKLTK